MENSWNKLKKQYFKNTQLSSPPQKTPSTKPKHANKMFLNISSWC